MRFHIQVSPATFLCRYILPDQQYTLFYRYISTPGFCFNIINIRTGTGWFCFEITIPAISGIIRSENNSAVPVENNKFQVLYITVILYTKTIIKPIVIGCKTVWQYDPVVFKIGNYFNAVNSCTIGTVFTINIISCG